MNFSFHKVSLQQKIISAVILFSLNSSAQTKSYVDDSISGYRGGYIKNLKVPDNALNFLVIGDWGRCGEFYQKEVAAQMAKAAVSGDAAFIISTGDNFYPKGVASINDPLWENSYEDIYHQFSLHNDWYVVLGNHDYRLNPQAEVDYTKKSARWNMPSRYYAIKKNIDDDTTQKVLFVFIDTNPLIDKYYSDPDYSRQVREQDSTLQKQWLIRTLSDPDPSIRWRFVVGHHPLYTSGKRIKSAETLQFRKSMEGVFIKYKVDAYFCGHEHQLEYIKPEGATHHFISGSGSEVRDVKGSLPESIFKASEHGFILFSVTSKSLKLQAINWEGKILHEKTIER